MCNTSIAHIVFMAYYSRRFLLFPCTAIYRPATCVGLRLYLRLRLCCAMSDCRHWRSHGGHWGNVPSRSQRSYSKWCQSTTKYFIFAQKCQKFSAREGVMPSPVQREHTLPLGVSPHPYSGYATNCRLRCRRRMKFLLFLWFAPLNELYNVVAAAAATDERWCGLGIRRHYSWAGAYLSLSVCLVGGCSVPYTRSSGALSLSLVRSFHSFACHYLVKSASAPVSHYRNRIAPEKSPPADNLPAKIRPARARPGETFPGEGRFYNVCGSVV